MKKNFRGAICLKPNKVPKKNNKVNKYVKIIW